MDRSKVAQALDTFDFLPSVEAGHAASPTCMVQAWPFQTGTSHSIAFALIRWCRIGYQIIESERLFESLHMILIEEGLVQQISSLLARLGSVWLVRSDHRRR